MYSVDAVERIMREQNKNFSDLAEYIYGDRRHTVRHLVRPGANPTSEMVEKVADFLGVPIDMVHGRFNSLKDAEKELNITKKLVQAQEESIKAKDELIAALESKLRLAEYILKQQNIL